MFKFIRKKMNKKGFTLVELLVVIAVLGIIAGIAIPRMSGVTDSFKLKADKQTAANLARQTQIRIQMGVITLPTEDGKEAIIITTDEGKKTPATWFGEIFDTNTQSVKDGFFVIVVDKDNIIVYAGSERDTKPTVTTANTLTTMVHGGAIVENK